MKAIVLHWIHPSTIAELICVLAIIAFIGAIAIGV